MEVGFQLLNIATVDGFQIHHYFYILKRVIICRILSNLRLGPYARILLH